MLHPRTTLSWAGAMVSSTRTYGATRLSGAGGDIVCAPQRPPAHSVLFHVARRLGLRVHARAVDHADAFVFSLDATYRVPPPDLVRVARERRVVNLACTDISKRAVAAAYEATFSQPLAIDPRVFHGLAVAKPDLNSSGPGEIVLCPTQPRPGTAYQRLVDNLTAPDVAEVVRAPVFAGAIPFVWVHRDAVAERFRHRGDRRSSVVDTALVLTSEESQAVASMCARLGADYAEVDVLRDRPTGQIFVVDVNPTPWTYNALPARVREQTYDACAEAFAAAFLEGGAAVPPVSGLAGLPSAGRRASTGRLR